jgi:PAS domain S-box-containing protein
MSEEQEDLKNFLSMNINPTEFYQPLFDSAGEGIILVNEDGVIIMANIRMVKLFGYEKDELIGENLSILIPKSVRKSHKGHFSSYFKSPKMRVMGKGMTLSGAKKNGDVFSVEISLNHFMSNGEMYAIALITDISDRKEAENKIVELNEKLEQRVQERTKQLTKSEQLYSAIARNFPDGTINVLDKKLNYVFVEGKELFKMGVTSETLIGTNYTERLPENIAGEVSKQLNQVFSGKVVTFELELDENYYVLDAVPLTNENKKIEQVLVVEKNVTQNKKAENEMKKTLKNERELNRMKSRFVSMASHEFRTPLSTILSSASLISKYRDKDQQPNRDKHIVKIKSSVHNLTSILNDFLSLEKLEAGKINCVMEDLNIEHFCNLIIEDLQGLLKSGQEIIYTHTGAINKVNLDKQLIGNSLLNLLSNSIKYSEENQKIELNTSIKNNMLKIDISDEGIGIPKREQKHLFDRFFRAENATNIQGTGLGLNITKKYIDLMNGSIAINSKEKIGTTVSISIPQKKNNG